MQWSKPLCNRFIHLQVSKIQNAHFNEYTEFFWCDFLSLFLANQFILFMMTAINCHTHANNSESFLFAVASSFVIIVIIISENDLAFIWKYICIRNTLNITFAPQANKILSSSNGCIKIMASAKALCKGFATHSVGMLNNRAIQWNYIMNIKKINEIYV